MHTRLFVLFDKHHATTSAQAQCYTDDKLAKEGFVYDFDREDSDDSKTGRFGCGRADYYSIGGPWTGTLERLFLDQTTLEKFWADCEKARKRRTCDDPTDHLEIPMLWYEYFPDWSGDLPLYLPNRQDTFCAGDAMLVTRDLWRKLMAPENWPSGYVPRIDAEDDGMIYLDGEPGARLPDEEMVVDKMWVCVVDFHT